MSLVRNAAELVPGDPGALRERASGWAARREGAQDEAWALDAGTVGDALARLADRLEQLQKSATDLYAEVRAAGLPEDELLGNPDALRVRLDEHPLLRPVVEDLASRAAVLRADFTDAQFDLIEPLQEIATRRSR